MCHFLPLFLKDEKNLFFPWTMLPHQESTFWETDGYCIWYGGVGGKWIKYFKENKQKHINFTMQQSRKKLLLNMGLLESVFYSN